MFKAIETVTFRVASLKVLQEIQDNFRVSSHPEDIEVIMDLIHIELHEDRTRLEEILGIGPGLLPTKGYIIFWR